MVTAEFMINEEFNIKVLPKVENILLNKTDVSFMLNTDTKELLVGDEETTNVVFSCSISDDKGNDVSSTVLVCIKTDDNDENNIADECNETVLSSALVVKSIPISVRNDEVITNEEFNIVVIPKVEIIVPCKTNVPFVFSNDTNELLFVDENIIPDGKGNVVPSTVLVVIKTDDNDENNIADECNETVLSSALVVKSIPVSVRNDEVITNEEFNIVVIPKVEIIVPCKTNVPFVFNNDTNELLFVDENIIPDGKGNVVPSTVLVVIKTDDNDENNIAMILSCLLHLL
ncbi:hypothetical protein CHS0354_036654 [Potamilus streckersoni]|uniref:Uncharacterized protein n=1 Tax=Potamilus streckersoni TaxID=2493646 RepID=A0AAE0SRR8_9BIVA|nr:hypothetical protein CHS0354_036654 [Potamilus streckersoni]